MAHTFVRGIWSRQHTLLPQLEAKIESGILLDAPWIESLREAGTVQHCFGDGAHFNHELKDNADE